MDDHKQGKLCNLRSMPDPESALIEGAIRVEEQGKIAKTKYEADQGSTSNENSTRVYEPG